MGEYILIIIGLCILAWIASAIKSAIDAPARRRRVAEEAQRAQEKIKYTQSVIAWRAGWRSQMDNANWIPKGSLSNVMTEMPPPMAPDHVKVDVHGIEADTARQIEAQFNQHNTAFKAAQRIKLKSFFDTVEKNPLTTEQVDACICMDPSVQIVAAAGSGKTSTMVAKTGYALHEGVAKPSEVLLLAFNKDAAEELGQRVRTRLAGIADIDQVVARTFNAFGLDVIGEATGRKPSVAPWIGDAKREQRALCEIMDELGKSDPSFKSNWDLFRSVYARSLGPVGEKEIADHYSGKFISLADLPLKSGEERTIADWLFYNNVDFQYERPYPIDTATRTHGQYRPDFYYAKADLYHEHFALDRNGRPPAHFANYAEGVTWKRQLHTDQGTKLFETHSHQIRSGQAFVALDAELRKNGIDPRFDPDRETTRGKPLDNAQMAGLVRTFMQHVKSNGLSFDDLRRAVGIQGSNGYVARLELFLTLYQPIASAWNARLAAERCIDFEDMLVMAGEHIDAGRYPSPFKLVLADEFQDSSRARIRMLRALTNARDDVHLCVVGDDWQGINRFAGADISVMAEFEKHFEHATRLTLGTTFRCPQAICDASSAFIRKNPAQIVKAVTTTNTRTGEAIITYGFHNLDTAPKHLEKRLARLADHAVNHEDTEKTISVMLLGRYRRDEPANMQQLKHRFEDALEINFRTVHSSKGLEADYIVLLNVIEGRRGFPSQLEDDPILQIPMPTPDPFPMAEERRLFYVALTRAKRQVWIYTDLQRPSSFIAELVTDGRTTIIGVDGHPPQPCPQCGRGVLIIKTSQYGPFHVCSTQPECKYKRDGMPPQLQSRVQ